MENSYDKKALPKVSVIVPTYNYADFLPEALRSVLAQTFTDYEVIIVDDGSTDSTSQVIKPFLADTRVRYIYQRNKGQSAARNTGIRHATGEFVAFLDADDIWLPEKLEKQVPLFDLNGTIALVYCKGEYIDLTGRPLPDLEWPLNADATYKDYLYANWIGTPSAVIVKKRIFDTVGFFDENLKGLEDMDMWLRILRHHKSTYADEVLVKMRRHIKSMQAGKMIDLAKREREYLSHLDRSLKRFPELEMYKKEASWRIYEGLIFTAYVYGKKFDMFRFILKAGIHRPSFWFSSIATYLRKYFLRRKRLRG